MIVQVMQEEYRVSTDTTEKWAGPRRTMAGKQWAVCAEVTRGGHRGVREHMSINRSPRHIYCLRAVTRWAGQARAGGTETMQRRGAGWRGGGV